MDASMDIMEEFDGRQAGPPPAYELHVDTNNEDASDEGLPIVITMRLYKFCILNSDNIASLIGPKVGKQKDAMVLKSTTTYFSFLLSRINRLDELFPSTSHPNGTAFTSETVLRTYDGYREVSRVTVNQGNWVAVRTLLMDSSTTQTFKLSVSLAPVAKGEELSKRQKVRAVSVKLARSVLGINYT